MSDLKVQSVFNHPVCLSSDSGLTPAPALIPASLSKPVELGGVTYRVVEKHLDWTGALHLCESLNGTLATVKDPFQQAYLTLLINSLRHPAWIALYNYGVSLLTYSLSHYIMRGEGRHIVFHALVDCEILDIFLP